MKQLTSYPKKAHIEENLQSVLMMCELWFTIIVIQENEAWDMTMFTSYPLTRRTDINLPAEFIMSVIHIIIKNWSMKWETAPKLSFNSKH